MLQSDGFAAWLLPAQMLYAAASEKLRCHLFDNNNAAESLQPSDSHLTVSLAQVAILGTFSHIVMSSLVWHTEFIPALSNKLWMQLAQLANV